MKKKSVEILNKNHDIIDFGNHIPTKKLYPILKWAGGKEQELKYIIPNLPEKFTDYYEPFVGGGAVYTTIRAKNYFINDRSEELIGLYKSIINEDRSDFFSALREMINSWYLLTELIEKNSLFFILTYKKYSNSRIDEAKLKEILFDFVLEHSDKFNRMFSAKFDYAGENFIREIKLNLIRKVRRMKELEKNKLSLPDIDIVDNIETAFKSAFYMHFRKIYNHTDSYGVCNPVKSAIFLYIRNFAYSGMFRYNSKGEFNVPYGGIDYNRKNFQKKVDYLETKEVRSLLERTVIENLDFKLFFKKYKPSEDDFIFLDPPYDSEFSTYAKNEFTKNDQRELANFLIKKCNSKWMLVIKKTDFILSLYDNHGLNIRSFDKTYLVSFMNRNNRSTEHLIITNY